MSEKDRELLLDASFKLGYFVELAGNLVLLLTTHPTDGKTKGASLFIKGPDPFIFLAYVLKVESL